MLRSGVSFLTFGGYSVLHLGLVSVMLGGYFSFLCRLVFLR